MEIRDNLIYIEALSILKKGLNDPNANFREGQYEAIEAVFKNRRSLVIQKTGWGKSFVYFISTKINRNKNKGVSIVISPLLVLIDNQKDAARKLGLTCDHINSSNYDSHEDIIKKLRNNKIDLLFTTPESLFNILAPKLKDINIGMFIIDEAHCISDWGHDFRLDYRKIVEVLDELKHTDFPILATTATANNLVINDLKKQIGPNLYVSRGSLYRDNLKIQLIDLNNRENRYAWILEHINELPGTGIIYCLTTRDCDNLTLFLKEHGIKAEPYHSSLDTEVSDCNLNLFVENKIKVLIATIKLGMGYDKPDVSFIIHYQVPKNIVSYYQQIGRAARNIKEGTAILLKGGNDFHILEHFIEHAFPNKKDMDTVLEQFEYLSWDKTTISAQAIAKRVNMTYQRINRALRFLEFEKVLSKDKNSYSLTGNKFKYNEDHYQAISKTRKNELEQLQNLFTTKECLNKIIINNLDDNIEFKCGKCINCLGYDIIPSNISNKSLESANSFIDNEIIEIIPRDKYKIKIEGTGQYQYPNRYGYARGDYIKAEYIEKEITNGFSLSKYGDEGIGSIIGDYKYSNKPYPEIVYNKAIRLLTPYLKKHNITHITFVPSLNNNLMDEFALNLSKKLNLRFVDCFVKLKNTSQKNMENYHWQIKNSKTNYELKSNLNIKNKFILLVDDMIDSRYTITHLGIKLFEGGASGVFPMALANSSTKVIDND